jgi:hypothetical protein
VLGPGEVPEVATYDAVAASIASGAVDAFGPRLDAIRSAWPLRHPHLERIDARVVRHRAGDHVGGPRRRGSGTSTGWSATLDGELGAGIGTRSIEPMEDFSDRLDRLVAFVLALRRHLLRAPEESARPASPRRRRGLRAGRAASTISTAPRSPTAPGVRDRPVSARRPRFSGAI